MHWGKKRRLKDVAFEHMFRQMQSMDVKIPIATPCKIRVHVFLKGTPEADPRNFVTPVDKMLIDALCDPSPPVTKKGTIRQRFKRGLGLIPDDKPKYIVDERMPELHYMADEDMAVLNVYPKGELDDT